MAVTVTVQLLSGRYDAGDADDRVRAEWPPHPARLFCALVAAARGDEDRAALRWLEARPAPVVIAAASATETRHSTYVVANKLEKSGGNLTHPGRTNALRTRSAATPLDPRVSFRWSGDAPTDVVHALDAMARRVPYLGRSTGVALVAATAEADDDDGPGRQPFEPCDLLDGELSLRVPYPGYLDRLDEQFTDDRPAWEVSRFQAYRPRREPEPALAVEDVPAPSVYTDLVVLTFSGLRPQADLVTRCTEALRSAVLRQAGRPAPEVLHGHGADGRPHVAFLALPDVGYEHSDGHLLGLAVAVPDLPAVERAAILRAVRGLRHPDHERVLVLDVPRIGRVDLLEQPGLVRPWGAAPERWRQGSRRWVSATPVVLDRFPKRGGSVEGEICAGLRRVGLPDPVDIEVSTQPLTTGTARLRPEDLPRHVRGRLFRHVAVTFDRRVAGPVLLGAGRYLGIGLLAPDRTTGERP